MTLHGHGRNVTAYNSQFQSRRAFTKLFMACKISWHLMKRRMKWGGGVLKCQTVVFCCSKTERLLR